MKRKQGFWFLVNIIVGIGVIAVSHGLTSTPFGASSINSFADQIIYNEALEAVEGPLEPVSPDGRDGSAGPAIRFLDIDDETHLEWGEPLLTPRGKLAEVVEASDRAGVKVLVLDVLLDKPSDPAEDEALRQALAALKTRGSSMKVILAAGPRPDRIAPAVVKDILESCPTCYLGAAEVMANGYDRTIRYIRYFRPYKDASGTDRIVWGVPFLASALYYDAEERLPNIETRVLEAIKRSGPDSVRLDIPAPWRPDEVLTIDSGGSITDRIRFRLIPPGVFNSKSRSNLLLGDRFQFRQLPFLNDELRGSILMVGNSFGGCCDLHVTPVGNMAGMYVLGNSINTLVGHFQVKEVPSLLLWVIEILSLVAFAWWLPLKRASFQALVSLALFFMSFIVYVTLMKWNIYVNNTFLFFGTSIYVFVISILDDMVDLVKWLLERRRHA